MVGHPALLREQILIDNFWQDFAPCLSLAINQRHLAIGGNRAEPARSSLVTIQVPDSRHRYVYRCWLCRCSRRVASPSRVDLTGGVTSRTESGQLNLLSMLKELAGLGIDVAISVTKSLDRGEIYRRLMKSIHFGTLTTTWLSLQ